MDELTIDQIPLFAGLSAADRQELQAALQHIDAEAGTVLMVEGDPGDSLVIILAGELAVIKARGTPDERLLRVVGPGGFLGEMSLFERGRRRTATVVARTDARILPMTRAEFDHLLQRRPQLATEMMRVMSLRLRQADNATIRDLHEKNVQLARAYEELQAAQAELIEKDRLEQELQLAGQIQQSMLPQRWPSIPGIDFGALMVPARAVGGDFFDLIPLDGRRVGVVVADVSDKGMPAAIFMALSRSLLRAEAVRGDPPGEVLLAVNHHLLDMNEAGMFLTVLYGILDTANRQFTYARAGHELPLVFDGAGKTLPIATGTGQLLGLFPDPLLDRQTVVLPPGGRLILLTDGVTDAVDEQEEAFGGERLLQAIRAHLDASAQDLCNHLLRHVTAFQANAPQFDDFTVLTVRAV